VSKTVTCPECGRRVRPCNLTRHRRTHIPEPEEREGYTYLRKAKRPIRQYRTHDHRYDEHFPRGYGALRFRLYRLRAGVLEMIAVPTTADDFGQDLYELHKDEEFITDDATGVLDTVPDPGDWIVHPFALGRRLPE